MPREIVDGLTADETAELDRLVTEMRQLSLGLADLIDHARVIDDAMQSYGDALFLKVATDGTIVKNVTGLAGAKDLTKAEIKSLLAKIAVLKSLDTDEDRQLLIKAVGAHNCRSHSGIPGT